MNWHRLSSHSASCRFLEVWRAGRPELQDHLLDRDRRRMFERVSAEAGVKFQVFGTKTPATETRRAA